MRMFEYARPGTVEEVLSLLDKYGKGALPMAGGTDLMLLIKKKTLAPDALISLQGIPELKKIVHNGALAIGPMVTHRTIECSPTIRKDFSALTDAEDVLGSVQIRNVGTIGGNVCTAAPSADTAPPLLVLGTQVRVKSLGGERQLPLEDFFTGPGATVMKHGEIVTDLTVPAPSPFTASAYWKHQRRLALDLPIVGTAVLLSLDKKEISRSDLLSSPEALPTLFASLAQDQLVCREIRIALGVAAPVPMRARKAEALLRGQVLTQELLEEAARTASEEAQPRDSVRGEAWYRKEMIKVFVKRMILKCMERIACGQTPAVELPGKA